MGPVEFSQKCNYLHLSSKIIFTYIFPNCSFSSKISKCGSYKISFYQIPCIQNPPTIMFLIFLNSSLVAFDCRRTNFTQKNNKYVNTYINLKMISGEMIFITSNFHLSNKFYSLWIMDTWEREYRSFARASINNLQKV